MARPPLPPGSPGAISVAEESGGAWVARCHFRDHDRVTRRLRKHGPTKTAAKGALHDLIRQRQRGGVGQADGLTPALDRQRPPPVFGLGTGLRIGESLAVRLDDAEVALEALREFGRGRARSRRGRLRRRSDEW